MTNAAGLEVLAALNLEPAFVLFVLNLATG
jgi:hypothetical protein